MQREGCKNLSFPCFLQDTDSGAIWHLDSHKSLWISSNAFASNLMIKKSGGILSQNIRSPNQITLGPSFRQYLRRISPTAYPEPERLQIWFLKSLQACASPFENSVLLLLSPNKRGSRERINYLVLSRQSCARPIVRAHVFGAATFPKEITPIDANHKDKMAVARAMLQKVEPMFLLVKCTLRVLKLRFLKPVARADR